MSVGTYFQLDSPQTSNLWEERQTISQLTALYEQAKEMRSQLTSEWTRNYRITHNRAAPAAPAAAGIRANEIFPTVDSRIGWMTDQDIQFTLTPACDPHSLWSLTTEILGTQLEAVLNSVMKVDNWYAEIVKMLWDAAIYGAGFLKSVWDAGLESGLGNVSLRHTSAWCLYPDPFATSLDDAQYVFEVHTMTPTEIERRFPDVAEDLISRIERAGDTDTDHVPPNQQQNRTKQGALIPIDAGQGATTWGQPGQTRKHTNQRQRAINVYECWIRQNYEEWITPTDPTEGDEPKRVVTDEWRVVVYAADKILLDETSQNLFHTDRHPYVRYVDVETGEFWGSPILRDLAPCQMAMNTLLAMAQNNVVFTGNPIMIGVKGSGVDRSTFLNRPGQIYDVNNANGGAQANRPGWLAPPELPQSLLSLISFYREEMERIAGLNGSQRGDVPSGRATDKQVQGSQEAGFVRIRSAQRNFEGTLRKAGELLTNLIIINYDVPRFVAIVGDEGETSAIKLSAQHFYSPTPQPDGTAMFEPMKFAMTVNAGSSKPTSRAARIQEAIQLKGMNCVDDQFVLEAFRVSHAMQVLKRKQDQEKMQLQLAEANKAAGQADGGKPPRQPGMTPRPG